MNREKLIDALGGIEEDMLRNVDARRQRKKRSVWLKWGAAAACLCLVVGIYGATTHSLPPGGAAGGGGNEGIAYMSYAGPVFPLNALGLSDGITVQRNVDYDFSPYKSVTSTYADESGSHSYEQYSTNAIVTDSYTMTNNSGEDRTLTLLYPFAASLRDEAVMLPEVRADGAVLTPELLIGPYSGGFTGAWGGGGESLNLAQLNSWEQYKALLTDGEYLNDAMSEYPKLDQPVVVYELSDRRASAEAMEENPDIVMEMTIDYDKTTVLSYGFNSGCIDSDTGYLAKGTVVPRRHSPNYGTSAYLIILGEEPASYTLTGYRDGGWEQKDASVTATVKRYESTLGEMLRICNRIYYGELLGVIYGAEASDALMSTLTEEQCLGVLSEHLLAHGVLAGAPIERYDGGALESILADAYIVQRVMYLRFALTIPAGEHIALSARMEKEASMDFIGKKRGRNGFDLVTQLGSSLAFSEQSASVSNTAYIELLDQNFGFDLENGITAVTLDHTQEYYWMEVRKREA